MSVGNILLSSDPARKGFLHDFDYSYMGGPVPEPESTPAASTSQQGTSDSSSNPLTERTVRINSVVRDDAHSAHTTNAPRQGTFYYMAIGLLVHKGVVHGVRHDLESFYWVLVFLVLFYTAHNLRPPPPTSPPTPGAPQVHAQAQNLLPTPDRVFLSPSRNSDVSAGYAKDSWVLRYNLTTEERDFSLRVDGNAPLTDLIEDFRQLLVAARFYPWSPPPVPLTHDAVLGIFRKAVARREEWPENDFIRAVKESEKLADEAQGEEGEDEDAGLDVDGADADNSSEQGDSPDKAQVLYANPQHGAPANSNLPSPNAESAHVDAAVRACADAPGASDTATAPGPDTPQQPEGVTTRLRAKRNAAAASICHDVTLLCRLPGRKRRKTGPMVGPISAGSACSAGMSRRSQG